MEEGVSFRHVVGVDGWFHDGGVVWFEVGDVEEVWRGETVWFVYFGGVGGAVVQGAEACGEGDMTVVGESGLAEDEDAILEGGFWFNFGRWVIRSVLDEVRVRTFVMPSLICANVSSGIGLEKSTPLTSAAKVGFSGMNSISCL